MTASIVQIYCATCDTPTFRSQTIPTPGGPRICPACTLKTGRLLPPAWLSVLQAVVDGDEFLSARQAAEIGAWL